MNKKLTEEETAKTLTTYPPVWDEEKQMFVSRIRWDLVDWSKVEMIFNDEEE